MSYSPLDLPIPPPEISPTQSTTRMKGSGLSVLLLSDPAGVIESPASTRHYISMHVGPPVVVACNRGGYRHRGTAVHGDIDIIPAGIASRWEVAKTDTALVVGVSDWLVNSAAEALEHDAGYVEITNRFQIRDPQLENIGLALKAEMDGGFPSGRLYLDGLALSLAARLVQSYSSKCALVPRHAGRLSGHKLKLILSYVEENLAGDLRLADIARVADIGASHFKKIFRESVGLPVHQYVIRRRIERAHDLLVQGRLPISQIALETGFAHQSHLAYHLRRIHGVSPTAIRNAASGAKPRQIIR